MNEAVMSGVPVVEIIDARSHAYSSASSWAMVCVFARYTAIPKARANTHQASTRHKSDVFISVRCYQTQRNLSTHPSGPPYFLSYFLPMLAAEPLTSPGM